MNEDLCQISSALRIAFALSIESEELRVEGLEKCQKTSPRNLEAILWDDEDDIFMHRTEA